MTPPLSPLRRLVHVVLALLAGSTLLAVPAWADDDASRVDPDALPEDPLEALLELRDRQLETASTFDVLSATEVEARAVLTELETFVDQAEAAVDEANRTLVDAELEASRLRLAERRKAQELAELEALMADIAVQTFISPPSAAGLTVLLEEDDLERYGAAEAMLGAKADHDVSVADALLAAREELTRLRTEAEASVQRAEDARFAAEAALSRQAIARDAHDDFVRRLEDELDETALRLLYQARQEEDLLDAYEAQTQAMLDSSRDDVPLAVVRGFKVHEELAVRLELLLEAAEADGIVLQGWGHRSTDSQVALRRANCGGAVPMTTVDDEGNEVPLPPEVRDRMVVFEVPASRCSPPTAQPGASMHELGLAIDFTLAGQAISTRSSPGYLWLAEHAADYGFYNLPSEPWHWSVNGN